MPISKVLKNVNKGTTEEESNENNEDEEDLFFSVQTSNICSKLIIVSLLSILQSRTYNVAMTPKKSKYYAKIILCKNRILNLLRKLQSEERTYM